MQFILDNFRACESSTGSKAIGIVDVLARLHTEECRERTPRPIHIQSMNEFRGCVQSATNVWEFGFNA